MSGVSSAIKAETVYIPGFNQSNSPPYGVDSCCAYGLITGFGGGIVVSDLTPMAARQWWEDYAERYGVTALFANLVNYQSEAKRSMLAAGWEVVKEFTSITTGSTISAMMFIASWEDDEEVTSITTGSTISARMFIASWEVADDGDNKYDGSDDDVDF